MAGILSYEAHRELVNKLFEAYLDTTPPGCAKVTLQQLQAADTWIFEQIATYVRPGVLPDGCRTLP
eukprot:3520149-Amphidinium_carterae.1